MGFRERTQASRQHLLVGLGVWQTRSALGRIEIAAQPLDRHEICGARYSVRLRRRLGPGRSLGAVSRLHLEWRFGAGRPLAQDRRSDRRWALALGRCFGMRLFPKRRHFSRTRHLALAHRRRYRALQEGEHSRNRSRESHLPSGAAIAGESDPVGRTRFEAVLVARLFSLTHIGTARGLNYARARSWIGLCIRENTLGEIIQAAIPNRGGMPLSGLQLIHVLHRVCVQKVMVFLALR